MYALIKKLALLTAFCFALEVYRLLSSNSLSYIFLPFNLILAWVPLGFAVLAAKQKKTAYLFLCFVAWLVFFPNAPYIITDLIHLKPRQPLPVWYDSMMVYCFAFTGFIVGMFSALIIYKKLKETMPRTAARLVMIVAMLASGYGIYLGRVLRWNSWNIVTHPTGIFYDTMARIADPFSYPRTYGMTLIFGALLWLVFSVFESLTANNDILSVNPQKQAL